MPTFAFSFVFSSSSSLRAVTPTATSSCNTSPLNISTKLNPAIILVSTYIGMAVQIGSFQDAV